jgi:hypothetical protein
VTGLYPPLIALFSKEPFLMAASKATLSSAGNTKNVLIIYKSLVEQGHPQKKLARRLRYAVSN